MRLHIEVSNIQHINNLRIELDLNRNGLTCIVGKNGVGKTTLIKSIRNLKIADTFSKMSQAGAIKPDSKISYTCDGEIFDFEYDQNIEDLNCRTVFPVDLKKQIEVELPMPWGQRFNTFQSIRSADNDIRTAVMLEEYIEPKELVSLLSDVYSDTKFANLKEVRIGKNSYYVLPLENDRYVREDHLSSGEFFLISLYRKIKGTSRLIVIDEIDISLDAAAQSRLVDWLRQFCKTERVNIVFTTHSMAIMRTMGDDELHYMYSEEGIIKTRPASYNYIKSILFGFSGHDRYILTEDPMLEGFFKFLINTHGISNFFSYQIIPVGGGDNVMQLLRKNSIEGFLGPKNTVIAILDGDYANTRHGRQPQTFCIPFPSIEKKIFADYQSGKYTIAKPFDIEPKTDKQFRAAIKKHSHISDLDLYIYLNKNYPNEIMTTCKILENFITAPKPQRE